MRVLNYIRGEFVDPESDFWMDNFPPLLEKSLVQYRCLAREMWTML